MTEAMIVEAIRNVGGVTSASQDPGGTAAVSNVANPSSVARFEAAMGTTDVNDVDPIPFASEITASWRTAQANNQGILHRVRALSAMRSEHALAAPEMVELQYEVANLAFQQEVVAKVADKSSNAIQTLVKNQ